MLEDIVYYGSNDNNVITLSCIRSSGNDSENSTESPTPTNANAVLIRRACKSYGVGKRCSPILCNLDITIPKGAMYNYMD